MRRYILRTGLLAAAALCAALAAPAAAKADFIVQIIDTKSSVGTISGSSVTLTVPDNATRDIDSPDPRLITIRGNTVARQVGNFSFDFITVKAADQESSPAGVQTGFNFSISGLLNTGASTDVLLIRISVSAPDGYPGSGLPTFLNGDISKTSSSMTVGPITYVSLVNSNDLSFFSDNTASATYQNSPYPTGTTQSGTATIPASTAAASASHAPQTFTAPISYSLAGELSITLGAGASASSITGESYVSIPPGAPAPAGAVLFAVGAPLLGFGAWLRRRKAVASV